MHRDAIFPPPYEPEMIAVGTVRVARLSPTIDSDKRILVPAVESPAPARMGDTRPCKRR